MADKGGEALLFDPRAGAAAAVSAAATAASSASASAASGGGGDGSSSAAAPPPRPSSALPKCVVAAFSLHEKKINTLSIDCSGGGNLFAASASDGSIQVFDLRKLLLGSASSSSASGSNKNIGDSPSSLSAPLVSIRHDNNTGRWITPFRAVFTPRGDGVVLGGMRRTVDVYSAADGRQLAALRSDFMTAIGSRVAMHAERPVLAAATASGRVNVWRNE